jgi:tryptophan halogenase
LRGCRAGGGFSRTAEASAIVLIELSAKLIAEQMPMTRGVMDIVAKRFNETTHYRWAASSISSSCTMRFPARGQRLLARQPRSGDHPERLQELLHLWRYQGPWFHDEFDRLDEVFPAASYQYVLYGMNFRTEVDPACWRRRTHGRAGSARKSRADRWLAGRLPRHRDLIRKIVEYGMQPV